jgi:hypothetical protein
MASTAGFSSQPQDGEVDRLAVILILDNSGSMQGSDPAGLRFTGARLFVSLLDAGDSAGLIVFSTGSRALSNGLVTIGAESQKNALLLSLTPQASEGYTDIKAALEQAADMATGYSPTIVLLTDGKPEIADPYPTYEQETLAFARSLGLPVMGIALTHAARTPFLDQLAAETGGVVIPADTASDLLDAYLTIFGRIKDRTVIGEGLTTAPGEARLSLEPGLAPFIEKASFLVGKPAGVNASLVAPDGTRITIDDPGLLFSVTDDPDFMVLTVAHPQGGDWTVRLDGAGPCLARAILHSRLRAEIASPAAYHQAGATFPVVVRMLEEDRDGQKTKIVGEANFSAQITLPDGTRESLDRFYDDGTHGDRIAGDGDYTRLYVNTQQVGAYLLKVEGRKGAVKVETSAHVESIPFPTLVVDEPPGSQTIRTASISLSVHLEGGKKPSLDRGQIIVRVISPAGEEQTISLVENGDGHHALFFPREEGTYQAYFESRSATYFGLPYTESIEVSFEVDLPQSLQVDPVEVQPPACFERDIRIDIPFSLSSTKQEAVEFYVEGLEGFQAAPLSVVLQPGKSQASMALIPAQIILWGGEYEGTLVLGARPGLEVSPGRQFPVRFRLPSLFGRCSREIGWGGGTTLLVCLVAVLVFRRARAVTAPPVVTGTLRYGLAASGPGERREQDLTALQRTELVIGSGETCDLVVPELAARHAVLRAVRTENGERVMLEALEEVRKGYGVLHAGHLLEHGDRVRLGAYEFQYLSDTGV